MITPHYIVQQFGAIIAMLRGRDWEDRLDMTSEGVFRSFWALPLSIPLAVTANMLTVPLLKLSPTYPDLDIPDLPPAYDAGMQIIQLTAAWIIVLFLLVGLAQQIRAGARITPLIVSYNWSVLLLQGIICLGVLLIAPTGQFELLILFYLMVTIFWLFVRWRLIRQTLESELAPTIGILVMLFLASQLVGSVITDLGNSAYTRFFMTPNTADSTSLVWVVTGG